MSLIIGGETFPPTAHLQVNLENGQKEGIGVVYSSTQVKLGELNFKNDLLDGLCIFRDDKGNKIKECVFEKGKKNGWIQEYKGNNVVFTGICRNDEKYSELLKCTYADSMFEEIKDGKRIGIWKFTDSYHLGGICYCYDEGLLTREYTFKDGYENHTNRIFKNDYMKEFDENGKRVYEGGYNKISLQREGTGYLYDSNQYLIYSGDWREGKREGKGCYYKNNQITYKGEWKNDKPNGEGVYYNKDGEVILEGEWIDGVIEYQYEKKFYYEDGKYFR